MEKSGGTDKPPGGPPFDYYNRVEAVYAQNYEVYLWSTLTSTNRFWFMFIEGGRA